MITKTYSDGIPVHNNRPHVISITTIIVDTYNGIIPVHNNRSHVIYNRSHVISITTVIVGFMNQLNNFRHGSLKKINIPKISTLETNIKDLKFEFLWCEIHNEMETNIFF